MERSRDIATWKKAAASLALAAVLGLSVIMAAGDAVGSMPASVSTSGVHIAAELGEAASDVEAGGTMEFPLWVENTGEEPCLVRVRFTLAGPDGTALAAPGAAEGAILAGDGTYHIEKEIAPGEGVWWLWRGTVPSIGAEGEWELAADAVCEAVQSAHFERDLGAHDPWGGVEAEEAKALRGGLQ